MFDQFRNKLLQSDEKWAGYISCFKRIEVPAKTILLKEGEISKKVFLIEKGCIRVWFNTDGRDVTFQFFFENNTTTELTGWLTRAQMKAEPIFPG